MQNSAIFPIFYLAPIDYFAKLRDNQLNFCLEKHEHFPKQTFRNRTSIATPDGILDLFVPVIKGAKVRTPLKDVKISYDAKWQRLHWLSMKTCYRSSAYFEYYEDGLAPFYEKRYDYLFDFNVELLTWLLKQMKLEVDLKFTDEYEREIKGGLDFRNEFNKQTIQQVQTKNYFQVFSDRNEFIPNLSIVDLLFNQGPQTKSYL